MYTYAHINVEPKTICINEVKWKGGDAFETEIAGKQHMVIMIEMDGFFAFNFESRSTIWFANTSDTRVRLLNVTITTSYKE
jgi:hypothetical protein